MKFGFLYQEFIPFDFLISLHLLPELQNFAGKHSTVHDLVLWHVRDPPFTVSLQIG